MNASTDPRVRPLDTRWLLASRGAWGALALAMALHPSAMAAGPPAAPPSPVTKSATSRPATPAPQAKRPKLKPLVTAQFVDLTIRRSPTGLQVLTHRHGRLTRGARLRRYAGPCEVLLYAGKRLRDRVQFSFPLTLGGMPAKGVHDLDLDLARGVSAIIVVRIPYDPSLTHLRVRERQGHGSSGTYKLTRPPVGTPMAVPGPTRAASFGSATPTAK